jgi:hypothetical protein
VTTATANGSRTGHAAPPHVLDLRAGELIRVRTPAEIFATLDDRGELDGMPFMPEMLKYCGRTFRVSQRADRTCAADGIARRMPDAVHLENLRCDGAAHGGCQAACLMYWKEAWLERAEDNGSNGHPEPTSEERSGVATFVDDTLLPATIRSEDGDGNVNAYRCQATEVPRATGEAWRIREVRPGAKDLENWSLLKIVRSVAIEIFNQWQDFSRRLPAFLRIAGGRRYPFIQGPLKKGQTPAAKLDLQPGELVRVKSKEEIVATLDTRNRNRGMSFDAEQLKYCGREARVLRRVNRIIDEPTGKMMELKNPCIILEDVICTSDYHRLCPRGIYPYWREIWLERVT